jgi:hypothetical protein
MVMTDPITDPLGLDRPEREDDDTLPPALPRFTFQSVGELARLAREVMEKKEAERLAQDKERTWSQR